MIKANEKILTKYLLESKEYLAEFFIDGQKVFEFKSVTEDFIGFFNEAVQQYRKLF